MSVDLRQNEKPSPADLTTADLTARAMEAVQRGDAATALPDLEELVRRDRSPRHCSLLGFCLAMVRNETKAATALCHDAIKRDPKHPEHYYRLGQVFLIAGKKKDAIWIFRMGLRQGNSKEIIAELARLGCRRSPPLPFLGRGNPLNKYLGIILSRLGLR
jgi:predicted Zn-dependent protease